MPTTYPLADRPSPAEVARLPFASGESARGFDWLLDDSPGKVCVRAVSTGESRPLRAGDWYLGAGNKAHRAEADAATPEEATPGATPQTPGNATILVLAAVERVITDRVRA